MVYGQLYRDKQGRSCYRPPVPSFPNIADVSGELEKARIAIDRFDRRLSTFGMDGAVGRLFARLDAVHSSGAEGSTTTFTDLMEYASIPTIAPDPEDAAIVEACADAFETASAGNAEPLTAMLAIHRRLFANDRDPHKSSSAGRFKSHPNAVYDADEPNGHFYYTHPDQLTEALQDWLAFTMKEDNREPELLRQVISHWMFESIHPMTDGNGRIGRLLLPLMLRRKGVTSASSAFIGEAVHADKDIYIAALKDARRTGNLAPWCKVALSFMRQTAENNLSRLDQLDTTLKGWKEALVRVRSDSVLHRLAPWMLTQPAFTVHEVARKMDVSFAVANNAIASMHGRGILSLANHGARNRLFLAHDVLNIFDRFRNPSYNPAP